jgi:hypothetical protein
MKKLIAVLLLSWYPAAARAAADCAKSAEACAAGAATLSPFLAASAAQPVKAAAPYEAAVSSAAPAAPTGKNSSNPLWLIFVGGSVAGLYFYLGAGEKKRRRK